MADGGIIILGEYDDPDDLVKWPGAKVAVDHFLRTHDASLSRAIGGRPFIVKRGE